MRNIDVFLQEAFLSILGFKFDDNKFDKIVKAQF